MANLHKKIDEYYENLRFLAEKKADENLEKALEHDDLKKVYTSIKGLALQIALAKVKGDNIKYKELVNEEKALKKEFDLLLKKYGIDKKSLSPVYSCSKCKDTGIIGTNKCTCYEKTANMFLSDSIGVNLNKLPTFEKALPPEQLKLHYEKFLSFSERFPNQNKKHIIFYGKTGTGKTYLAGCIANRIKTRGYFPIFLTAYELNETVAKYSNFYEKSRENYLNDLAETELLVIDDFGAFGSLKNSTTDFLIALINKRDLEDKTTLITTNLTPAEILDNYGERLFSRLFNKKIAVVLNFDGEDMRLKR